MLLYVFLTILLSEIRPTTDKPCIQKTPVDNGVSTPNLNWWTFAPEKNPSICRASVEKQQKPSTNCALLKRNTLK